MDNSSKIKDRPWWRAVSNQFRIENVKCYYVFLKTVIRSVLVLLCSVHQLIHLSACPVSSFNLFSISTLRYVLSFPQSRLHIRITWRSSHSINPTPLFVAGNKSFDMLQLGWPTSVTNKASPPTPKTIWTGTISRIVELSISDILNDWLFSL